MHCAGYFDVVLPGCGVANKHRQTVTAIDLALKRLEADAICRKCMEQRACRTQKWGVLVSRTRDRVLSITVAVDPCPVRRSFSEPGIHDASASAGIVFFSVRYM